MQVGTFGYAESELDFKNRALAMSRCSKNYMDSIGSKIKSGGVMLISQKQDTKLRSYDINPRIPLQCSTARIQLVSN